MVISLLSDFGLRDPYVGVMKGVIAARAPEARIIDITHQVEAQDIDHGAFLWAQAVPYFPAGTVHVAVVDPGVGSRREIVAARGRGGLFLAPDNGLLGAVLPAEDIEAAVWVRRRRFFLRPLSGTFHGRDIFAPVAAALACGTPLEAFGPRVAPGALNLTTRRTPQRQSQGGGSRLRPRIDGCIRNIDSFGNCITDIRLEADERLAELRVGRQRLRGLCGAYSDVAPGRPLVVIGSSGFLEIAVNGGRADRRLSLRRRQAVEAILEGRK